MMMSASESISVEHARKIAEKSALNNLKSFLSDPSVPLLQESCLEAEFCWIFFRNKGINVPAERALTGDWAYAVSKRGHVRQIADLSGDTEKMLAYLEKMSKYFGDRGE